MPGGPGRSRPPLTAATLGAFYWAAFVLILTRGALPELGRGAPRGLSGRRDRAPAARHHHDPSRPVRSRQPLRRLLAGRLCRGPAAARLGARRPVSWPITVTRRAGHDDCRERFAGCSISRGRGDAGRWGAAPDRARSTPTTSGPGRSPLSPRARSAPFFFGIGLAALIAAREDDPLSFRGAALAYTALGVLELVALSPPHPRSRRRPAGHGALRRVLGGWSS